MEKTEWEDVVVMVRDGLVQGIITRLPQPFTVTVVDFDNEDFDQIETFKRYEKELDAVQESGEFRAIY